MKILQMLEREDFYTINQRTLNGYFADKKKGKTKLFVYPQLNAIVTASPSKNVLDYLLCEYSVRANVVKQKLVQLYVFSSMKTNGLMASHTLTVESVVSPDMLIYPCNKKYRVFDFQAQTVDVIAKDGFVDTDLKHEIEFRSRNDLPGFVPRLVNSKARGYKESIIDGKPLARISERFDSYREQAYQLLLKYVENKTKHINADDYVKRLLATIEDKVCEKSKNPVLVLEVCNRLAKLAKQNGKVKITFSHGDLQPGNIWIENKTGKVYIIDWESWGERSQWYDEAVLFYGLRPAGLSEYYKHEVPDSERAVVLLEDIIFELSELNSLPGEFGTEKFEKYCAQLKQWLQDKGD